MVDARGGAMRGCRHSGVRIIIPPRKAPAPMRITCRLVKRDKLAHPPPLMEGEALASRILEMGPSGAKFLGPVIIEVPHFASLRGKEREITILRSDNGETWREHTLEATENAVQDVLNESFDGEELDAIEDLHTNRITRILTNDFPMYFAVVTRVHQETHTIGPEGGMVSSTVVPQVQAVFPEGALTKKIRVGLQAQPIPSELVTKLLGNRVAVSPIVTVEPRRRKFHKPITLTIPVPQAASKGMINQYSKETPTLRLLCSITGGTHAAQWEDITGTTPLTFVNECVSFTTTVSARFWLMDCQQVTEAAKFATDLYREAIHVPFMAKFVVFGKRSERQEGRLRVFCMTDDKMDKTLECQEHFSEVARSRDVEVLEGKPQYIEMGGNLVPVTKSGEQLFLYFRSFQENRLPFTVRSRDPHEELIARIAFMKEPRVVKGEPAQTPICNLNIRLPEEDSLEKRIAADTITLEKKYQFLEEVGMAGGETITKADLRLSDIAHELQDDWIPLALQLDFNEQQIQQIRNEQPDDVDTQALTMLHRWFVQRRDMATGNNLEKALRRINRDDIVQKCMHNVELVTDELEKAAAKAQMDQSGFEDFKEELGPSRDASMRRDASLDVSYDEKDLVKEGDSEASESEKGSVIERDSGTATPIADETQPWTENILQTVEERLSGQQQVPVQEAAVVPQERIAPMAQPEYAEEDEIVPMHVDRQRPSSKPLSDVEREELLRQLCDIERNDFDPNAAGAPTEETGDVVQEDDIVPVKVADKRKATTEEMIIPRSTDPALAQPESMGIEDSYIVTEASPVDQSEKGIGESQEKPPTPPPSPSEEDQGGQQSFEDVNTTTKRETFTNEDGSTVTRVTRITKTTKTNVSGDHDMTEDEVATRLAETDQWSPTEPVDGTQDVPPEYIVTEPDQIGEDDDVQVIEKEEVMEDGTIRKSKVIIKKSKKLIDPDAPPEALHDSGNLDPEMQAMIDKYMQDGEGAQLDDVHVTRTHTTTIEGPDGPQTFTETREWHGDEE